MKPQTQRRTGRWIERGRAEGPTPYGEARPDPRDARPQDIRGPSPYEIRYDISLGYSHDRSILLP